MRVLCVCKSGNVRSVTLGRLLKKRGAEVLCCGVDKAFRPATINMLAVWAEVIYCQKDAEEALKTHITQQSNDRSASVITANLAKIDTRFDVGPDDWKVPDHPLLLSELRRLVIEDLEWGQKPIIGD